MKRNSLIFGAVALCFSLSQMEASTGAELISLVKELEAKVAQLEERVSVLESGNEDATAATKSNAPVMTAEEWEEKVQAEVKKITRQVEADWTVASKWELIEVKMAEEEVLEILGKPTRRKFSVRKDTDERFIYEGDLTGEGALVEGEIRIYKGKVTRIDTPEFPANWK
ncbi:hypothetical protein MLD52_06615 [Puniceicoccaceae bacterium K14]|nr:hypothetical protein [Puniceicoccaceae bacterium K14]